MIGLITTIFLGLPWIAGEKKIELEAAKIGCIKYFGPEFHPTRIKKIGFQNYQVTCGK